MQRIPSVASWNGLSVFLIAFTFQSYFLFLLNAGAICINQPKPLLVGDIPWFPSPGKFQRFPSHRHHVSSGLLVGVITSNGLFKFICCQFCFCIDFHFFSYSSYLDFKTPWSRLLSYLKYERAVVASQSQDVQSQSYLTDLKSFGREPHLLQFVPILLTTFYHFISSNLYL